MRALARWGILPLLAAPAGAWALGLGNIELKSALNQPFDAQIEIVSATSDELQALRVGLAAPEMFTQYGLDRPAFLQALEFRVVKDRSGRGVINVTSQQSIVEPFVTLLVEATWPRGRLLREYTVLLDPPVLLPAPAAPQAVQPAETRATSPSEAGGPISRPAPPPARQPAPQPEATRPPLAAPQAEPAPQPESAPVSRNPPPPRAPAAAPGSAYGIVQRGDTLWVIADRTRPNGVTINQMMIAIYRANPDAFGGNINLLRAGASLQLPAETDIDTLTQTAANAEVRRQTDEWASRESTPGQLRLLPPAEAEVAAPAPAPAATASTSPAASPSASPSPPPPDTSAAAAAAGAADRRPLEVSNPALQNLQEQAAAPEQPPAPAGGAAGVDLESEQIFADDDATPVPAETETPTPAEPAPAPAATPAPAPAPVATGPSLVSQILGWAASPWLWIGGGVAALLLIALWFVRRRREDEEAEGITGRWEALESEVDDDEVRQATARMRRQLPEETIVVEEQRTRPAEPEPEAPARRPAAQRPARAAAATSAAPAGDETLSSQTVINLDQADAVAEADFHMAYGLYDQAAELVQKALEASPDRRDLKLKLLEVFFVWGNKDSFLKAAQDLRKDIGDAADADWDKVVIMGRQICPGEKLFTDATAAPGRVDVNLEAGGDAPLDLAFDDAEAEGALGDAALDFTLEASDARPAPKVAAAKRATKPAAKAPSGRDLGGDSLDIGEQTAAGLEAALFAPEGPALDDDAAASTDIGEDSLAITQESPTVERPAAGLYAADAPTVETPTLESPTADSPTQIERTIETPSRRRESPTVQQPTLSTSSTGEYTAEIDLDDLGLDVKDIEELPQDLGELPTADEGETDTRRQPALEPDDELLSATGVTKVLDDNDAAESFEHEPTSILGDEDATMLAPGFSDNTMTSTEVLDSRFALDDQSGDTSLVQAIDEKGNGLDLDLEDLTAALHGADTVEQPKASAFSRDVFGGGETPLDLDVGNDPLLGDDDPTGTEAMGPLDAQTMTEVGTKLDLARAYIDMGDPEGARSILEEVLDEGDPNQRREAQSLIDVLTA
jgi:pilus assembly protein FimV